MALRNVTNQLYDYVKSLPPSVGQSMAANGSYLAQAVVLTAAESDPNDGSVMAIAAQTLPKRFNCSSVATPEIAALPSP